MQVHALMLCRHRLSRKKAFAFPESTWKATCFSSLSWTHLCWSACSSLRVTQTQFGFPPLTFPISHPPNLQINSLTTLSSPISWVVSDDSRLILICSRITQVKASAMAGAIDKKKEVHNEKSRQGLLEHDILLRFKKKGLKWFWWEGFGAFII